MKKILFGLLIVSVLMINFVSAVDCVVPIYNMVITTDTKFCSGEYPSIFTMRIIGDGIDLNCNDVIIRDLNSGIRIYGSNNIIRNCNLYGYSKGIVSEEGDRNTIKNNNIFTPYGIIIYDSDKSKIIKNKIEGKFGGITIQRSNNSIISRNSVSSIIHGVGIFVGPATFYGSSYNNLIVNNYVKDSSSGFWLASGEDNKIIKNTFVNNGIDIVDYSNSPSNKFINNIFNTSYTSS